MAGTGYNIPISVSSAHSFGATEDTSAGTVFNFSSPDASNPLSGDFTPSVTDPATATSSAAEGNAAAESSGSGVGTGTAASASPLGGNTLLIGLAVILFFVFKKFL